MVKPVRNDLTDTDLELVPAPNPLAPNQPTPTLMTVGRAVPSASELESVIHNQPFDAVPVQKSDLVGAWWGRVRTGLLRFRSGQT